MSIPSEVQARLKALELDTPGNLKIVQKMKELSDSSYGRDMQKLYRERVIEQRERLLDLLSSDPTLIGMLVTGDMMDLMRTSFILTEIEKGADPKVLAAELVKANQDGRAGKLLDIKAAMSMRAFSTALIQASIANGHLTLDDLDALLGIKK